MTLPRRHAHRVVTGLVVAKESESPWRGRPRPKSKSAKDGLRFERAVAKALPGAKHGQWFCFWDANGPGYCQPDFLIDTGRTIVLLEVKLTFVPSALTQLTDLYFPVVERATGRPVRGVVVVKNLVAGIEPPIVPCLSDALALAGSTIPVLHWLGRSAIL